MIGAISKVGAMALMDAMGYMMKQPLYIGVERCVDQFEDGPWALVTSFRLAENHAMELDFEYRTLCKGQYRFVVMDQGKRLLYWIGPRWMNKDDVLRIDGQLGLDIG